MQVNPYGSPYGQPYGQPPMSGPAPTSYPQPLTYRPTGNPYQPDMFQPTRPGAVPPGAQPPQEEYQYVAQQDVAFGIAGAVAGFFIAGPIGALIGGVGLLLLSAIFRGIKHLTSKKEENKPPQMPQPPVYPNNQFYQYPNQGNGAQYQNQYNYSSDPRMNRVPQNGYQSI